MSDVGKLDDERGFGDPRGDLSDVHVHEDHLSVSDKWIRARERRHETTDTRSPWIHSRAGLDLTSGFASSLHSLSMIYKIPIYCV